MSSLLISFTEKLPQVSFGSFLVDNLDRRMRDQGSSTLNMRPVSLFEGFKLTSDRLLSHIFLLLSQRLGSHCSSGSLPGTWIRSLLKTAFRQLLRPIQTPMICDRFHEPSSPQDVVKNMYINETVPEKILSICIINVLCCVFNLLIQTPSPSSSSSSSSSSPSSSSSSS